MVAALGSGTTSVHPSDAGREADWYAPDVIETITSARVRHDIGSHSGRHIYFDSVGQAEAQDDLGFANDVHRRSGLDQSSFVFPRNKVAHLDLVSDAGFAIYRGTDEAWHERLRARSRVAGRVANLTDKILAIAPEAVQPERRGPIVNLPGSMLFLGRNGLRRFGGHSSLARQLRKGAAAAIQAGATFHLWFHPSNFYHRRDEQFAVFEDFLRHVALAREAGTLAVRPMVTFA